MAGAGFFNGAEAGASRGEELFSAAFVKLRVAGVKVAGLQLILYITEGFANTINMKWITKEPPTLFFNGILTNSQLFCAFIKVPLSYHNRYR